MRHCFVAFLFAALLAAAGCDSGSTVAAPKPAAPAKVEKLSKESDLATITLTPEAEARLGIKTVPVEVRPMDRVRMQGGEVVVPPGRSITVTAPLAGTLSAPAEGAVPEPGRVLAKDQPVFSLVPILSPEARMSMATSRVDAEGAVAKAQVEVDAAKIVLERAETLLREGAGSRRSLDDAEARLLLAGAALEAARSQRDLLAGLVKNEAALLDPLRIVSPMEGMLYRLPAASGQLVAAGAPLFEVANLDRIWIRVPVYVGDLPAIDKEKEALVGELNDTPGAPSRTARPVSAPPSADADSFTADLFYGMENREGPLRPGQKVGVTLSLKDREDNLAVSEQALLYDIHGGAWVYEKTGPHLYSRKRVQVRYVSGSLAALAQGPKPGTPVVTEGAAELFGIEFGVGK